MKRGIFPFDIGLWRKDAALAFCLPGTRGVWFEALLVMWEGRKATLTGSIEQLAAACRCTPVQMQRAVDDLRRNDAADITVGNDSVMLTCRFLARKFKSAEMNRLRVNRHREKTSTPPSVMPTVAQNQTPKLVPKPPPSAFESADEPPSKLFESLRTALNAIYGPTRRWSYVEESMLAEIARSGQGEAELALIVAYRDAMPPQDKARFFPNSLTRLLEKWGEMLDRARMAPRRPGSPPQASAARLGKELDNL